MSRTLSAALLLTVTGALGAQAAPAPANRTVAEVTPSERVQPISAEADESDALNCAKSRKRLWVEGEGWVVRKVTTCH